MDELKWTFIWYADIFILPYHFVLSVPDLEEAFGHTVPDIQDLASRLSLGFGSISDFEPMHVPLSNPIWTKPFIALPDKRYFIPIPTLLYSFLLEIAEYLLKSEPRARERLARARSEFAEDELESIMRHAFPSGAIARNVSWSGSDERRETFENDLLAKLDGMMVLMEAKSNNVTGPARRGARDRLKEEVRQCIVVPSVQSKRLAQWIESRKDVRRELVDRRGQVIAIDGGDARRILRVNALLDTIIPTVSSTVELQEAGLIPADCPVALTIGLAGLECVFEMLETEMERLHYLIWRERIEKSVKYRADEMDLLAIYIDNTMNIARADPQVLMFSRGTSLEYVDPYFVGRGRGHEVWRPIRRMTPFWREIVGEIERRRPPQWLQIGTVLLDTEYSDQRLFERNLKRKGKEVLADRLYRPDPAGALMIQGRPGEREAVVGMRLSRAAQADPVPTISAAELEEQAGEPVRRVVRSSLKQASDRDESPQLDSARMSAERVWR
jgi:hypothetical protein